MDKNKLEREIQRGIQRGLSEFQKVGPINGTLSQETLANSRIFQQTAR